MQTFVTAIHVFVGFFLIVVVLLQSGRSGGMGAAIGGGSSAGVFGARGANTFLSRLTAACAVVFFLTSMSLAIMSSKTGSVVKGFAQPPAPSKDATLDAAKDAQKPEADSTKETPDAKAADQKPADQKPADQKPAHPAPADKK